MDGFNQIGKYIKKTRDNVDYSLKRPVPLQISQERIREVFDNEHPVVTNFNTPSAARRITMDLDFGRRLPSLACCGDCFCGTTESYTSDSLVGRDLYLSQPYVAGSVRLWINGTLATPGVHFVESSSGSGKITITASPLSLVHLITISYVYTVGNCTEAVCLDDRFECLGYTFLGGLTTVFSDRFDRSDLQDPACGYYFTTPSFTKFFPSIFSGKAIFGSNTGFYLGGANKVVGVSVELLAAVDMDDTTTASFTFIGNSDTNVPISTVTHNSGVVFTKISSTVLRITVTGPGIKYEFQDDPFGTYDNELMRPTSYTATVDIPFTGGRYWLRFAQNLNGDIMAKAWPQFTPEPAGAQVVTTIADSYSIDPADADELSRETAVGTVNYVRINCGGVEAIMVGAGLDNGDWGVNPTAIGALPTNASGHGHYCADRPNDGLDRFGYDTCGSTITVGNSQPTAQWMVSYPTILGGVPTPVGTMGDLVYYDQGFFGIDVRTGHPNGLRLKGKIQGSIWENAISAEIKLFPSGPLTMGGINGIQGGQTLATYLVPPDGTPVDIDVFVPVAVGETFVRIGIHVPNLQARATSENFYFGPFLATNNVTSEIRILDFRADGIESVDCTTGPFCDDCSTSRCPEMADNFDLFTTTSDYGTGDFVRQINQGLPVYNDKGTNTRIVYSGNVATINFQAITQNFVNFEYGSPFDCFYDGSTFIAEARFDMNLSSVTGSDTGEFGVGNIEWDISSGGVATFSSGMSPSFSSTNVTTNAWWSVKYRVEGTALYVKTWLAGTVEPDTWNFTSTISSMNDGVGLFVSGDPSFTAQLRSVSITRGV